MQTLVSFQSRKMLHAALLLLMLEAANARPRFTISLKRGTQNSSAIHKLPADYPIFAPDSDRIADIAEGPSCAIAAIRLLRFRC